MTTTLPVALGPRVRRRPSAMATVAAMPVTATPVMAAPARAMPARRGRFESADLGGALAMAVGEMRFSVSKVYSPEAPGQARLGCRREAYGYETEGQGRVHDLGGGGDV